MVDITHNFYGRGEYSVQYMGDDYIFATEAEAQNFINNLDRKKIV